MSDRWKDAVVPKHATIKEALESISQSDLRIALVVDDDCRLLGVITDGDIRRGLIRNIGISECVEKIMNSEPKTAGPQASREELIELMRRHDLMHVPIVAERRLMGLVMLQDFVAPARHDNPVCIMAGGLGKRLRPLTENIPKPLLRVGGKPILEMLIENFVRSGFHRFFISIHYKAEQIADYFGRGHRWEAEIECLVEPEPLGTGGALGFLADRMGELPAIVVNGDLLTRVDFARVLSFHQEQGAAATICVREYEYQVPFGVVQPKGDNVLDILEKPVQQFLINAGIYVLNPSIVRRVPRNQPLDMPALLKQNIRAGERVSYFPLHEYWLDVGRVTDFEKAQTDIRQAP